MNLNYFSYLAEFITYCLVFPIMLRFILLILYIMDTMFSINIHFDEDLVDSL